VTKRLLLEIIGLSTARGRVIFVFTASVVVYFVPFRWLGGLSLWQRLGLDWVPSIGLTRAYWLLLHGRLDEALELNWLILLVVVLAGMLLAKDFYQIWTRDRRLSYTEGK